MQMSAAGLATLEALEGTPLRAYRDPVGIWTIYAGLTAASGVVVPKAGMVITHEEGTRLVALAMSRNYVPRVSVAMPDAQQHEFDAGLSFDWNTGAIGKATWVKRWRAMAASSAIRAGLMQWTKGGGRVLPGLKRRREIEADMLLNGVYPKGIATKPIGADLLARWAVDVSVEEIKAIKRGFNDLGYAPGLQTAGVRAPAVMKFQSDHGLTADGIIGRATLSTLQRMLDAKGKAKIATAAAAAPIAASTMPAVNSDWTAQIADQPWVTPALIAGAVIYAGYQAYQYRDAVAARIQKILPRLAAYLRSF